MKNNYNSSIKLSTYWAKKMNWGGRTERGYIHYQLITGEKISIPLGRKDKNENN